MNDLSIPALDGFTCLGDCVSVPQGLDGLGDSSSSSSGGFDYGALMNLIGGVANAAGQIGGGIIQGENAAKQQAYLTEQQKNAAAAQLQLAQYQAELERLKAETAGESSKAKIKTIVTIGAVVLGVAVIGGVAWKFLK